VSVRLVYETHATSTDNERAIATGWLPGALSARGRREAAELGARWAGAPPAAVFTSDSARAVETALLAFAGLGVPIRRDARLRECDYGALTGGPAKRVAAERRARVATPFPAGESYADVVARVDAFLDDLAADWDGRTVVVVGHSATRWALEHLLAGVPLAAVVDAPFVWQPGWTYALPVPRRGRPKQPAPA
jgi:alpha-ribazole phosphatase/probable phosphoglycerate mutase